MATSSSPNNSSNPPTIHSLSNGLDPDTTFVQTDPETFRAVVQRLTGAAAGIQHSGENGHRRTARKLKIKLHNDNGGGATSTVSLHSLTSTASNHRHRTVMASPVSPLEFYATPTDEEERAIAEKGFYLHPNPFSPPAGRIPPELLPLFPLHSPRLGRERELAIN